jgi:hypothetical protein
MNTDIDPKTYIQKMMYNTEKILNILRAYNITDKEIADFIVIILAYYHNNDKELWKSMVKLSEDLSNIAESDKDGNNI